MPALDLTGFLVAVSIVCCEYRGSVTSWWRTPFHNSAVGGVNASKHEVGAACDVVWDKGQFPDLQTLRMRLFPRYRVIREKDHDHIEIIMEIIMEIQGPDAVAIGGRQVFLAT